MTKDIILTISGLHGADEPADEAMEVITPGTYYFRNGKHFVQFNEVIEGIDGEIRSTMKFTENSMELSRKGATDTRLIFEKNKEYQSYYNTPVGSILVSIYTEEVSARIGENNIDMKIEYSLKMNGEIVAFNTIFLNICPKEQKKFTD